MYAQCHGYLHHFMYVYKHTLVTQNNIICMYIKEFTNICSVYGHTAITNVTRGRF